jgi:uncharacterized protein YdhG (YjbR/CyaY superfamily)
MRSRAKGRKKAAPKTVGAYLASLSAEQREALQKLRRTIRAALPRSEERISYGIPAFAVEGKPVVWFGAGARHCAFYPGGAVSEFADELEDFETSKGTIRFQPAHPLPAGLVRRLVKARLAKTATLRGKSGKSGRSSKTARRG